MDPGSAALARPVPGEAGCSTLVGDRRGQPLLRPPNTQSFQTEELPLPAGDTAVPVWNRGGDVWVTAGGLGAL